MFSHCFALLGSPPGLPTTTGAGRKSPRLRRGGLGYIVNAVTILMRIERITVEAAHEKVKTLAQQYEREAVAHRNRFLTDPTLPENVKRYVQAVYWTVGGASLWSSTCPRYR